MGGGDAIHDWKGEEDCMWANSREIKCAVHLKSCVMYIFSGG